ncbi:MAG: response regulator [Phycisphaerae bacterium]|nr:response regulator [Phycisphaerae bacterium]
MNGTKTILVVDDLAIFRDPIAAKLRATGYNVLTASDGSEALRTMSRHRVDLLVLDLGMPVMDGLSVLRSIRSNAAVRLLPVVILSAESDRLRIADAARLGISGYILKSGLDLAVLLDRIKQALVVPAAHRPPGPAPRPAGRTAADLPVRNAAPRLAGAPESVRGAAVGVAPALMSPQGPVNDLKSVKPIITRAELLQKMNAEEELTGFSPAISQLLKITGSSQCSLDQVARAVGQDHAVALKILRLANSSIYSCGDRVETVQKAVLRIGMQSIRQAVLNIGVVERFGSLAFERHLSTPLFWEHSIACGTIATSLARSLKRKDPESAFTAGLLHDLGRVLFAERLGGEYVRVLDVAQELQVPVEQVESRMLLMNHADVMGGILHAWRFPKGLVNPIVFHHAERGDVRTLVPKQSEEVMMLGLADRLAHAMALGSSGNDTIYPTEEHCRFLGVDAASIQNIVETAHQQTDDSKLALLSNASGTAWTRPIEQFRGGLKSPVRAKFVSAAPEFDAYRIFFGELSGPVGSEAPNLLVVHLTAPKESDAIQQAIAAAEGEAGVARLPLLLLAPGSHCMLSRATTQGRAWQMLSTPTPVSRLLAAVNALIAGEATQRAA